MESIFVTDSIYKIVKLYPEAQEVLVDLGFKPMAQMITVQTVGKVTSLETAIKHLSLNFKDIQKAFNAINVEVINE